MQETDYVGLVSGRDTDKSKVFKSFWDLWIGTIDRRCPIDVLCEITNTV